MYAYICIFFLYGKNLGVGTFSKYGLAVWSSGVIRRLRTHASPGTQGCGTFVERSWNVRSLVSGYLVDSGGDSGPGKSFLLFQSSTGEEVREAK